MEKINLQKLIDEAKNIADPMKRAEELAILADKMADLAGNNKNNRWNNLLYILLVVGLAYTAYRSTVNGSKINETKQGTIDAGNVQTIETWKGFYYQMKIERDSVNKVNAALLKMQRVSDSIMGDQTVRIARLTQNVEYLNSKR